MSKAKLYGVFAYDPTNMYRDPVRIYARRHAAEKFAYHLTFTLGYARRYGLPDVVRGYVVRECWPRLDPDLDAALATFVGDKQ